MKFFVIYWLALASILPAASLKFEKDMVEVKASLDAKEVVVDFNFTNNSSETLKIKDTDAGCTCLSVAVSGGKVIYAPGESGTLRATFELGSFQGIIDKPILVWLDGDPDDRPSITVTMRVAIPVAIKLEPKTLKWELGAEGKPQTIDVTMNHIKPVHIISTTAANDLFTVKLITLEKGKHYQVEVTPLKTDSPGLSIIRIETDIEVEKQRIQQAFGVIRAPLPKVNP